MGWNCLKMKFGERSLEVFHLSQLGQYLISFVRLVTIDVVIHHYINDVVLALCLCFIIVCGFVFLFYMCLGNDLWNLTQSSHQRGSLFHLFTGKYLYPLKCTATFHWSDPSTVGNTVSFVVEVNSLFQAVKLQF